MILLKNYLWCHVTWGAGSLVGIFLLVGLGDSKISYLNIALLAEDKILRLDVSVNDSVLVDVVESHNQARDDKPTLLLAKLYSLAQMEAQVSASHQITDKVHVVVILEGELHVNDERVSQLGKELALGHYRVE